MSAFRCWFAAAALFVSAVVAGPTSAAPRSLTRTVSDAITEMDVERARRWLERIDANSPAVVFERARLAVYLGECELAATMLNVPQFLDSKEAVQLASLAQSCARATVAGFVIEDKERGIWLRMQDDSDRALAPFIFDVAARARDAVGRDLGVDLPKPLRIDLVRDLFSLSAVSGLPLTAAETTGTLAVARWGRVIILTPRATGLGYPWQDTLAHEITHLMLTRASRDQAPLWLQEGIAKREETRWRAERAFDDPNWADVVARTALVGGRSVGIDKLGPSLAMLPTAEAASTAYAEVTSFMDFFLREAGEPGFRMLLADLRGYGAEGGADAALRSVTGYSLSEWKLRWEAELRKPPRPGAAPPPVANVSPEPDAGSKVDDPRELMRRVRLGDLLSRRGHAKAASIEYDLALPRAKEEPAVRWRAARASLAAGDRAASERNLGVLADINHPHYGWLALQGRFQRELGREADAEAGLLHALGLNPYSEDAACEGHFTLGGGQPDTLPKDPAWRALCDEASTAAQD
jgi:hypothetical protein